MFGTSVEEAGKRVSKWAAMYTHMQIFALQTANNTCSFVAAYQNTEANLTGDNQKRSASSNEGVG